MQQNSGKRNRFSRRPNRRKKNSSALTCFWIGGKAHTTAWQATSALIAAVDGDGLKLQTIANRGVKVYPGGNPDTFTVDHRRCRFISDAGEDNTADKNQLISLLQRFNEAGLDVIKTENLYNARRRERLFGVK
jgi:hypothetical protein